MKRIVSILLLVPLLLLSIGADTQPASQPAAGPLTREYVKVAGDLRSYLVHEPKNWDGKTKLPMLICLHGATDNAAYAAEAYGWVQKSDQEKFLAIFPEGEGDDLQDQPDKGQHYWTPGASDAPESDDIRFLLKMIDRLENRYAVDSAKVFLCGHSNGAVMAYALAARHPEKIAALGIVAGTVGYQTAGKGNVYYVPDPKSPLPLIIFHGREDPTLPYDPPPLPAPATAPAGLSSGTVSVDASQVLGVPASVAYWVKANLCNPKPKMTTTDDGEVTREYYTPADPKKGAPIILVTIKHGSHMWPGAKDMPGKTQKPSHAADATAEMWAFFTAATQSTKVPSP